MIQQSIQKGKNVKKNLQVILVLILFLILTLFSGCISIPGMPGVKNPDQVITPIPTEDPLSMDTFPTDEPVIITPEPTPTLIISTITDWNPYEVIPLPEEASNNKEPLRNRPSVLKYDTTNSRKILNTSWYESVDLMGYAVGKDLNITKGPFSITYSVHPKISNPLLVWAKLTVLDPWQNVTAEEGYNRGFSSDGTKTMTIYREGRYYLIIEGNYVTVDYTLKTGDPTPVPTPVQETVEE